MIHFATIMTILACYGVYCADTLDSIGDYLDKIVARIKQLVRVMVARTNRNKENAMDQNQINEMIANAVSVAVNQTLAAIGGIDAHTSQLVDLTPGSEVQTEIAACPIVQCDDRTQIMDTMPLLATMAHTEQTVNETIDRARSVADRMVGDPDRCNALTDVSEVVTPRHDDRSGVNALVLFHDDNTIASVQRSDFNVPLSTETFGQGPIVSSTDIGSLVSWVSRSGKRTMTAVIMGATPEGMSVVCPIDPATGAKSGRITRKDINLTVNRFGSLLSIDCQYVSQYEVPAQEETAPSSDVTRVERKSARNSEPMTTANLLTGSPRMRPSTEIVVFADTNNGQLSRDDNGLIHWVFPTSQRGKAALQGNHPRNSKGYTSQRIAYSQLSA